MKVEARGLTSLRTEPDLLARNLARIVDICWLGLLWSLYVKFARIPPVPRWDTALFFILSITVLLVLQFRQWGSTFGQKIWRLGWVTNQDELFDWSEWRRFRDKEPTLCQLEQLSSETKTKGFIVTSLLLGVTGFYSGHEIFAHPMISRASILKLTPLVPAQTAEAKREWAVLPFFYAFGAWPKKAFGDPVFYSLPYNIGPPTRFLGKIIARWKMPDIQLTLEGPKTPSPRLPRAQVKECMTSVFLLCPWVRKAILDRHTTELVAAGAQDWDLEWFEVADPPSGAPESPAQGLKVTGYGPDWTEERWILVTPDGTHQAITLRKGRTAEGLQASKLLQNVIRTLRVSDKLTFGQSLAALRVSEIDLAKYDGALDSLDLSLKLATAQATLLAKASVDPGDLDAYFHLGGTGILLLKHAQALKNQLSSGQSFNEKLSSLIQEWSAAAKPIVSAALRYGQDIDPENGKTQMLRRMATEAESIR